VTYLIVGLDRTTLAPWHRHVLAGDVTTAMRIADDRAALQGVQLMVVAVIGPNSSVLELPHVAPVAAPRAA
jgi:hypothetical protein